MTKRRIRIGHTAITWDNHEVDQAIEAIGSCGYWGTETFGWVLDDWEKSGRDLPERFQRSGLQLTSLYCHLDLVDPGKREEGIRQVMDWVRLYKQFNGPVVVIGGMMIQRSGFDITEYDSHITTTLNELARRICDQGLLCCFHPHTGTPVETEEEIRRVMDGVDADAVTFAPDLGQIAKGGSDPFELVKEYYELIRMVHIKDYIGGPVERDAEGREIDKTGFLGYTPLGMGTVNIQGILDYLEERDYSHYALVELDGNQWSPTRKGRPMMPPLEAIQASKRYLEQLGYRNFRTV
ncbi:sugar phosphate isomerase/epimerase [Paenibacillus doosanensis]|uniref:Inosose dehydratase n=1 Tax=Paenibacillus konkukensis TaxID=2020716 RepID=A0ABY4RHJ7_9BACL|nr:MULTISPECIES: sugar phosphate isomerase/epimerase [Paenibacillus]MCS7461338.1 sugar phosphate isomerase/epimerase [Paenibacillus doosanensis]UQZ81104.1 Inosose dehydratase [Paenibacillus konkukensis]